MALERVRINLSDIVAGFDILIIFKKEVVNMTKREFYKQLQESFIKAGIFKGLVY